MGHMSKACPDKKVASQFSQAAAVEAVAVPGKVSDGGWKEVEKKGRKTPAHQKEVPQQSPPKGWPVKQQQQEMLPQPPKGQHQEKEERQSEQFKERKQDEPQKQQK